MTKPTLPIITDRITQSQSMSLITSTVIGVSVLTLPRMSTEIANQQGWIPIFIGFLLAMAAVWVVTLLSVRMNGQSFANFVARTLGPKKYPVLGKVLGIPLLLAYVGYWLIVTALVARTFGEVVVTAVLLETPLEVIVGSMLALTLYLCLSKDKVVFRVNEFLLPLMVAPLLILGVMAFQKANFTRLMPVFPLETKGILQTVAGTALAFQGYEIILQFASRYDEKVKYVRANMLGMGFVGLVYVLIVIAGIVTFGHEELQRLTWPTLELVKSVNVPGLVLERAEAVFIGVWVAAVFTTAGNCFYAGTRLLCDTFGIRKPQYVAIGLVPVLYLVAMNPRNQFDLFAALNRTSFAGILLAVVIPVALLGLSFFRNSGTDAK
ncbi:GerAB/ArcD/ProY family transporter [Effusibacillus lacus]|uniref:Spore gernimation protein n=1 Tax=Effusibacillus lacus TaxID=1348429 RepID=A0A292YRD1_9BACL|nr:GerAB/ArcD/ProY family transporter [Effusibacillus lacus]TCS68952.1 spore germination protein [Effusibacillus lacus]GAX91479.1 spore gernimation protein [Effusibacillus lacus]